ncbi:MAG: hypothetical protein FJ398_18775 [Verrucomicrobia bacterium]|nr:hypothetical protein [Verrucomicrobiota bacterium]
MLENALSALSLRHVAGKPLDADDFSVFENGPGTDFHGDPPSAFGYEIQFINSDRVAPNLAGGHLASQRHLIRSDQLRDVDADGFLGRVTGDPFSRGIERRDVALEAVRVNDVRGIVHQVAVAPFERSLVLQTIAELLRLAAHTLSQHDGASDCGETQRTQHAE